MSSQLSRTGEWFLHSGIQQPDGGVARYYLVDAARNLPASTEITGYTASAFVYLHSVTHDARYLDRRDEIVTRAPGHLDCFEGTAGRNTKPLPNGPSVRPYIVRRAQRG